MTAFQATAVPRSAFAELQLKRFHAIGPGDLQIDLPWSQPAPDQGAGMRQKDAAIRHHSLHIISAQM
jgi:hypothetical protein